MVGRVQHRPDVPDDASGVAPGHGVLVETLRRFTGVEPVVAGKPARPLLDETVRRCGGERPLMVGDRLDTDIEGADAAGLDSLLVMTGVTGLAELVAARARAAADVRLRRPRAGWSRPQPAPEASEDAVSLGGWSARVRDGGLAVEGGGAAADWWRVVAVAAWRHLDETGRPAGTDGVDASRGSVRRMTLDPTTTSPSPTSRPARASRSPSCRSGSAPVRAGWTR